MNLFVYLKQKLSTIKSRGDKNQITSFEITNLDVQNSHSDFSVSVAAFLDKPPSYVLRGPIYLIFVILIGAIIFSTFTQIDDKVTSILIVKGEEYTVQAPFTGSITALRVNENDVINSYDRIVDIYSPDINLTLMQKGNIINKRDEVLKKLIKLVSYSKEAINLTKNLYKKNNRFQIDIPSTVVSEMADMNIDTTSFNIGDYNGLNEYKLMISDLKSRYENAVDEVNKNERILSKKEKVYNENKDLLKHGIVTSAELLNSENEYLSILNSVNNIVGSYKSDVLGLFRQISSLRQSLSMELSDLNLQIKTNESLSDGVELSQSMAVVKSQFPGVVSELYVKPSQMVSRGMFICKIIRNDFQKYGLVYLQNKDISTIKVGQPVFIKFDAFPYQEYGVQEGEIINVSKDTKLIDGLGYVYEAQVGFTKTNPKINLMYGVDGIAEIITGKKRLIELVFAPVGKIFDYISGEDKN